MTTLKQFGVVVPGLDVACACLLVYIDMIDIVSYRLRIGVHTANSSRGRVKSVRPSVDRSFNTGNTYIHRDNYYLPIFLPLCIMYSLCLLFIFYGISTRSCHNSYPERIILDRVDLNNLIPYIVNIYMIWFTMYTIVSVSGRDVVHLFL